MAFDQKLARTLTRPWKLRLWMLTKLPMGLLTGMYIKSLDHNGCTVVLKDHWWIRNPFKSVFWAVMGMAAELSTGALVYSFASGTGVKFILVGMEAQFFKKAKGKTSYVCDSGQEISRKLEQMMNTDDPGVVIMPAYAKDESGNVLAEFKFQWQLRKPIS